MTLGNRHQGAEISHVVIIGAGIVGASTAVWLRRLGADVTVIDRDGWGLGTSFGNGGVLAACAMVPVTGPGLVRKAPGMLLDREQPLFMRWGYFPRLLPWLRKYLSFANDADTRRISAGLAPLVSDAVEQHLSLSKQTNAADWITQSDYSFAYPDEAAFWADSYVWDRRSEHGFAPQIRQGADVHAHEPSLSRKVTFLASMKDHGYVRDPGGYVAALGAEFATLGGKSITATAMDFELSDGQIASVLTDRGPVSCDTAVVTSGVWSKPLLEKLGLQVPMETERGYHILFKAAKGGPSHPIMLAQGKFVATPMADGVRCAGILEFGGLDAGPSKAPFEFLRRKTKAAFPNMTWEDEIEWQGHRPAPSDSLPLIGEIKGSGIFAGFGHHHIGLTAGPKTGRILANLITGHTPNLDLTPYAPTRFA